MSAPLLSEAEQAALDKYAECAAELQAAAEFVEWLAQGRKITYRAAETLDALLDEFFGIDRKNLESGRILIASQAALGDETDDRL